MDWLACPFRKVAIHLNAEEAATLLGSPPPGGVSGLQRLIGRLRRKLSGEGAELSLNCRDVRRINRLAFTQTSRRANQRDVAEFLRLVFERSLGEGLNDFGGLYRKTNQVPGLSSAAAGSGAKTGVKGPA